METAETKLARLDVGVAAIGGTLGEVRAIVSDMSHKFERLDQRTDAHGDAIACAFKAVEIQQASFSEVAKDLRQAVEQIARDHDGRMRLTEVAIADVRGDLRRYVAYAQGAGALGVLLWTIVASVLGVLLTDWRTDDRTQTSSIADLRRDVELLKAARRP